MDGIIIGIADIHIPNFRGIDEYREKLNQLILKVRATCEGYGKDAIRIVLLGDLIHNKNNVSNELISTASLFIYSLEEIGHVCCIAGNHDLVLTNKSRLDTISTIFTISDFKNSEFLDQELGYESGCVRDGNIIWCVYSIYDDYAKIDMEAVRKEYGEGHIYIGLFHGALIGSSLPNGYRMDKGVSTSLFEGCDLVLCGDIHKRQVLKNRFGTPVIYAGSVFQRDFGESVNDHGFVTVRYSTTPIGINGYEFTDVDTDYGLYKMEISSPEDIDNEKEKALNF